MYCKGSKAFLLVKYGEEEALSVFGDVFSGFGGFKVLQKM